MTKFIEQYNHFNIKVLSRTKFQKFIDFVFFPLRAISLYHKDNFGLSCLATDRFDYVSKYVKGFTLDIGCGRNNIFIKKFLMNRGIGLDLYPYEGLTKENLVESFLTLPFDEETFETVTFIANFNHIPKEHRIEELNEAYRVLKKGGNIIITMGNPLAEIIVHKLVKYYDEILKTDLDMDGERGMVEGETLFVLNREIKETLKKVGFINIKTKYFFTQWLLNHLIMAVKP